MDTQKRQHSKFKEVLIFVAGTTPQIITETIYGLIHKEQPIYPDEIYILTTKQGKKIIKEKLIEPGIFENFCEEFNLSSHIFNENSIKVITTEDGKELDDIKDWNDSVWAADFIVNFIREKSQDLTARLHCSIAGGRKTMSFYLGSALQLFGRPWDKLYHVLVSPEFELNPEFYYKPKKEKIIKKNNLILNTKDAQIHLAELPFIRFYNKISISGKSFKEMIAYGQKEIDIATIQYPITINLSERTIYIGDTLIKLTPIQLMIFVTFLKQKIDYCKHPERINCLNCTDCFVTIYDLSTKAFLERMAMDYKKIYNQSLKAEEFINKHKDGLGPDSIRQNISKINKSIKEQLQEETLPPYYIISNVKKYADSRYGIRIEKGKININ